MVSARGNEELKWEEGQINFGGSITVGRNPVNSGNITVISTPIENSAGGFSRNDVINSFCNDDSSIAGFDGRKHTLITDGSGGMFDGSGSTTWQVNQNGTTNVNNNEVSGPLPVNSTRGGAADMYAMYFGFCKHAKVWHHYSTKIYDDFLDDMKKYQTDSTNKLNVINTTPRNGGEAKDHLALTAGYPLIFAKKGQTVKYEIEFKDKTLKYDMWLKVGAFKSNEAVTAANAKNRITKVTGKAVSKSSLTNAFKYDGSKVSTIEFEVPKDGYVFMKWSKEGNNATGGGILLPKNEITIIKQD